MSQTYGACPNDGASAPSPSTQPCREMTGEEAIAAARAQILEDIEKGYMTVSSDGQSVTLSSPSERLRALDQLEATKPRGPHMGLRFTKLIPPSGGGSP